jgi:hypothetical protein
MGFSDTARAKAQAAVSRSEAEVADLTSKLNRARAGLDGTDVAGDLLGSVKDVTVIGPLTSGLRDSLGVDRAKAQAEVDRLTAELSVAQDKLAMAQRAQAALQSVVGPNRSEDDREDDAEDEDDD